MTLDDDEEGSNTEDESSNGANDKMLARLQAAAAAICARRPVAEHPDIGFLMEGVIEEQFNRE